MYCQSKLRTWKPTCSWSRALWKSVVKRSGVIDVLQGAGKYVTRTGPGLHGRSARRRLERAALHGISRSRLAVLANCTPGAFPGAGCTLITCRAQPSVSSRCPGRRPFKAGARRGQAGVRWVLECAPRARTIDKLIQNVPLVKRPITPPFQGGGRGFESHTGRQPSLPNPAEGCPALARSAEAGFPKQ